MRLIVCYQAIVLTIFAVVTVMEAIRNLNGNFHRRVPPPQRIREFPVALSSNGFVPAPTYFPEHKYHRTHYSGTRPTYAVSPYHTSPVKYHSDPSPVLLALVPICLFLGAAAAFALAATTIKQPANTVITGPATNQQQQQQQNSNAVAVSSATGVATVAAVAGGYSPFFWSFPPFYVVNRTGLFPANFSRSSKRRDSS